ncbi:MAG: nucleic acid-binding protein [Cyanosarcina radialis HA8281-LM2]|jgi:predicted nucleic acid-binding protein|nr:nucleic acid-binding protein [Cyanosarcina radialis HA8281-LM2]
MKLIFADTFYWIALLNPKDNWHQIALDRARNNTDPIVTTDGIIDEVLNYAASKGNLIRQKALLMCTQILRELTINIIAHTPKLRQLGFDLFEQRSDKGYSLTDCISMIIMRQRGITDVLTHDKHFTQEGFHILF